MSGFAATVLVSLLIGAVHGSNPLAKNHLKSIHVSLRQASTEDCYPFLYGYPPSCLTALEKIGDSFNLTDSDPSVEDLNTYSAQFCTTECVQPYVEFYNCSGQSDVGVFLNSFICGQYNGEYCTVSYYDNMINDTFINNPCVLLSSSCEKDHCVDALDAVLNGWGCCLAGYHASLNGTECVDVIGSPCPGVTGAGDPGAGVTDSGDTGTEVTGTVVTDSGDTGTEITDTGVTDSGDSGTEITGAGVTDSGDTGTEVTDAGFVVRVGLGLVALFAMLAAWAHVALF